VPRGRLHTWRQCLHIEGGKDVEVPAVSGKPEAAPALVRLGKFGAFIALKSAPKKIESWKFK
jgi:topoisomerase IA-like protein